MTFSEHDINRETDGKFGAKVGGKPEVTVRHHVNDGQSAAQNTVIPERTAADDMDEWLDGLDPKSLASEDSAKLGRLQARIEALRIQRGGHAALEAIQRQDPTVTDIAVIGREDDYSSSYSTRLHGVYRGDDLDTDNAFEYERAFDQEFEQIAGDSESLSMALQYADEDPDSGHSIYRLG